MRSEEKAIKELVRMMNDNGKIMFVGSAKEAVEYIHKFPTRVNSVRFISSGVAMSIEEFVGSRNDK